MSTGRVTVKLAFALLLQLHFVGCVSDEKRLEELRSAVYRAELEVSAGERELEAIADSAIDGFIAEGKAPKSARSLPLGEKVNYLLPFRPHVDSLYRQIRAGEARLVLARRNLSRFVR